MNEQALDLDYYREQYSELLGTARKSPILQPPL